CSWPVCLFALSLCLISVLLQSSPAVAQAYVPAELTLNQLPQEHGYQQTLRTFMSTLRAKDFEVERKEIQVVPTNDSEELYRFWLLSLHLPPVTAATLPASGFTLSAIEAARGLVMPCPPVECQHLAWLTRWDYPGNVYRGSRPLQLRAFMLAATDMMMLD